jgi:hypothetical protein
MDNEDFGQILAQFEALRRDFPAAILSVFAPTREPDRVFHARIGHARHTEIRGDPV